MLRRKSSWMIAICAIVGLSLLPCAAARADLLLYYNLDEGTGTTATDLSGKGNTATVGGGWTTDGMSGNAASILYSDPSSVVSTDNAIGLGSGDFSISLWFKGSFNSDWRWLVCDGPTDTGLYFATVGSGFRCSMGGWFNPDVLPTQGDGFNSTSWYNVMLVRNGTTVSAYIGGKLNSSGTSSANIAANQIRFGSICDSTTGLNGAIDDIAVWNQALTVDQIKGIGEGTLSPLAVAEIPEPTTFVLTATGLLGLLAYAWRKRK